MKTLCTSIAIALAAVLQAAVVPTEWQVRIGPKATVFQAERYHGDALALRATLTANGQPLPYQGTASLYAQTNGMGIAWWNLADATVSNNVLTATWLPEYDTGADVVDLFLGAPGSYQAHARIRFLPSPGATPGTLPLPTPVLNFAEVQVLNAPYYTQSQTDARILELSPAAQGAPNYAAVSNAAMSAAAQTNDFLRKTGGILSGRLQLESGLEFGYGGMDGPLVEASTPGDLSFSSLYPGYSGRSAVLSVQRIPAQSSWEIAFVSDVVAATNAITHAELEATTLRDFFQGDTSLIYAGYDGDGISGLSLRLGIDGWSDWHFPSAAIVTNIATDVSAFAAVAATNYADSAALAAATAATNYTDASISAGNDAFVLAVTNCPVVIATDSEIAEYGTYGTVAAALAALAAGLAALKRGKVGNAALGSGGWYVTNGTRVYEFSAATSLGGSTVATLADVRYPLNVLPSPAGAATLADRQRNLYVGDSTYAQPVLTLPPAVDGDGRDFYLDVDNSSNSAAVAFDFYNINVDYVLACDENDDVATMTEVAAGERVRLYFNETALTSGSGSSALPVIQIARITLGAYYTGATT